jgi:tRNA-Thr(GGU) m(6)t(6)A37 methyltransferase TsaA
MSDIILKPIGVIHSPFAEIEGMPIQPVGAIGTKGTIDLREELVPGLKDLDGFSHIILIYHFHRSEGFSLHVKPFLDDTERGVFSTRAPRRPNPIGLSVVRLTGIQGSILTIEDIDVLDGTPLLDIKPFVPQFDSREVRSIGWLSDRVEKASQARVD